MNHELAGLYGKPSILTIGEGDWQDTMAGACFEDARRMSLQEGVRQRSPVQRKTQGSTVNSMAGPGEVRPFGDLGYLHGWEAVASDRASWKMIIDRVM